jgi:hypothetical protein
MSGNDMDNSSKLPFNAPKLEVYGRARDITRNVGTNSKVADGGTGQTNKTN